METINYERIPHIIERQYASEQAFLAEFEAGNYTLTNPLVKLNPYEFCPLTAVVMFETPVASEATITVLGKKWKVISLTDSLQQKNTFCQSMAYMLIMKIL